jgi:Acyl dehydratase
MKEMDRGIVGFSTGKETFSYTWRDLALYALGVGATAEELEYQYEVGIKALPTFGVVPYWGTFGITPRRDMPSNACFTLNLDRTNSLHLAHKLIMHKPLDPKGGTLTIEDTITEVFDRGGKSTVIRSELIGYDESGEKGFTNVGDSMFGAYTAEGSPAYPRGEKLIPEQEPDVVSVAYMAENQHLIYRLSGDTNTVHADPEFAKAAGFPGAFMQGLCAYGYVGRMAINALFPGQPEKLASIDAQMRNIVYPGTEVALHLWKLDEGRSVLRLVNTATQQAILENGLLTWN